MSDRQLTPETVPHGAPVETELLEALLSRRSPGTTLVAGLTGSVAAGKSTLSTALCNRPDVPLRIDAVSTDGFLFSNDILGPRGLLMRKGFPETYDQQAMRAAVQNARRRPITIPRYSHQIYDIDPGGSTTIDRPDILLLEGLGLDLVPSRPRDDEGLDALIYLDAEEDDLEHWYVERFTRLLNEARSDPGSFYTRFLHLTPQEADAFAREIWNTVNLPNLRNHIAPLRDRADILLRKDRDHNLTIIRR